MAFYRIKKDNEPPNQVLQSAIGLGYQFIAAILIFVGIGYYLDAKRGGGHLFTLIGVVFPKRAMVVGVFYTLAFEVFLAMIPAVVNLLTIQFRLRCLLVRWMNWDEPKPTRQHL